MSAELILKRMVFNAFKNLRWTGRSLISKDNQICRYYASTLPDGNTYFDLKIYSLCYEILK
jgi:hypothetical protein